MDIKLAEEELKKVVDDLIKRYNNLGLRASGKYEKALRTEIKQSGDVTELIIWGAPHGYFMEYGRKETKTSTAGTPTLLQIIEQWLIDKGLTHLNAYAVTKKIHEEGIEVPNKYNIGQVISFVIKTERVKDITDKLAGDMINKEFSKILEKL